VSAKVNAEGLTFEEWDAAARLGEEAKVRPIAEEREAAVRAAFALGGEQAGRDMPYWSDVYHGLRLSPRRARAAWRAGEDPTEYAAAPRPLPRRASCTR
jgi:hypothetical protein